MTLFGVSGAAVVIEELTLNGTTVVPGSTVWDAAKLLGVWVAATTAGTVTVREIGGGGVDVFTVPAGAGARGEGAKKLENSFVNSAALDLVLDAAGTPDVLVLGRSSAGVAVREAVTMNGTTPVSTVATGFGFIDWLVTGEVAPATNVTVSAQAVQSVVSVQSTLQKTADFFNAKRSLDGLAGFFWTLETGDVNRAMSTVDGAAATNIFDPATLNVTADLDAIIQWFNINSSLVSAARATGATLAPKDTPAPRFLLGGSEGVATFADYQKALNLLKDPLVNSIVDLSGDPAVAAALDAHCAFMGGIGRKERDGFVGLVAVDGSSNPLVPAVPATKDSLKSQIVDLNTRHIRACGQFIERFNPAGERTEYASPFMAAILAGMQAGSPVGTSLTYKFANVLGFRQDSTWNPIDDADEMIAGGMVFFENVDGQGRRVVRNVTTHLSSNNLAFTEGSVNEAVNTAVFNLRTNLEFAVGQQGFAGTVSAVRTVAVNTLGLLVDEGIITGYRNLDIELNADVMDVSVELAPVIPINFIRTTVHLVTQQQLAQQ